jgi:pyruvate/2-oxoglutarate dehydrogenase complex dihydrolipoamide dehydrogenase (E3) component
MPSKALLATSARSSAVRKASELAVIADFKGIDPVAMQIRKRLLVGDFAGYRSQQLQSGKFSFLRGKASFVDPHTLKVDSLTGASTEIRASYFLIATGSTIFTPEIPGLLESNPLDSDTFLSSETIPSSIVILGGGAIALEAATFYAGAGSQVTILQRSSRILKEAEPEASESIAAALVKNGVTIHTSVKIRRVHKINGGAKCVEFATTDGPNTVVAAELMHAFGRVPATRHLGLERANVSTTGTAISVLPTQQTTQPHVFAAGDVCSPLQVVHIAIAQAEVSARNILRLAKGTKELLEHTDYRLKLLAIFSEPGFASVGFTEHEAIQAGHETLSSAYPFNDHGRSMVDGYLDGFVKLVVSKDTREILGATVVGPHAAELIHEIVVAMHFRASAGDLARIPHYHPTLSEIWTYPAEDLA